MAKKPQRTRLEKLKNSWCKASPAERQQFLDWLGTENAPNPSSPLLPISTGRYLTPGVIARIEQILALRRIGIADVMAEMGFDRRDSSLLRAMARGTSLRLVVIAALETWLAEQAEATVPASLAPYHR